MKTLRIGIIILLIGVSLLFATNMRTKTMKISTAANAPMALGPFLLEPRQTIIVLTSETPDNVTIHVVPSKNWEATQNISLANPVFTASGMRRLYAVTFRLETRGVYYFVVTMPNGTLIDEPALKFEQTGLAQDLYMISITATIIGMAITTYNSLKFIIKRKRGNISLFHA